jgi:hypothetical protein
MDADTANNNLRYSEAIPARTEGTVRKQGKEERSVVGTR